MTKMGVMMKASIICAVNPAMKHTPRGLHSVPTSCAPYPDQDEKRQQRSHRYLHIPALSTHRVMQVPAPSLSCRFLKSSRRRLMARLKRS